MRVWKAAVSSVPLIAPVVEFSGVSSNKDSAHGLAGADCDWIVRRCQRRNGLGQRDTGGPSGRVASRAAGSRCHCGRKAERMPGGGETGVLCADGIRLDRHLRRARAARIQAMRDRRVVGERPPLRLAHERHKIRTYAWSRDYPHNVRFSTRRSDARHCLDRCGRRYRRGLCSRGQRGVGPICITPGNTSVRCRSAAQALVRR